MQHLYEYGAVEFEDIAALVEEMRSYRLSIAMPLTVEGAVGLVDAFWGAK